VAAACVPTNERIPKQRVEQVGTLNSGYVRVQMADERDMEV
jgi:hypothetical protein